MRHSLTTLLALTLTASVAAAQSPKSVFVQPSAASYTIGEGTEAITAEQVAIPLALVFRPYKRLSVDFTTAVAYTRVVQDDSTLSEIYGGTDTQLRAHLQLLMDHLVLTVGANAPSGQYYVDAEQQAAASVIGNDFLYFPISSMGNGPSGTAGLAFAWQLFNFNLGVGASMRKSMEFTPYGSGSTEVRYQPADETRLQLTVERALWLGTASVGVTMASFGDEEFDSTTYSTGDRVITSAGWAVSVWRAQLALGLWHLGRDAGEVLGGPAPKENIRNVSATLSVPLLGWTLQPNIEKRRWRSDGAPAGEMTNYGITIRIPVGEHSAIEPRFGSSSGTLHSSIDASTRDIGGWQGSLLIRVR